MDNITLHIQYTDWQKNVCLQTWIPSLALENLLTPQPLRPCSAVECPRSRTSSRSGARPVCWHRPRGTTQSNSTSVPVIKMKGDTPCPPPHTVILASVLFYSCRELQKTLCGLLQVMGTKQRPENGATGYTLLNQAGNQKLWSLSDVVLNCKTWHENEQNRQWQHTLPRSHCWKHGQAGPRTARTSNAEQPRL